MDGVLIPDCGEGIISNLWSRTRESCEKRGFASVRESDKSDVCDRLQLQCESTRVPFEAVEILVRDGRPTLSSISLVHEEPSAFTAREDVC